MKKFQGIQLTLILWPIIDQETNFPHAAHEQGDRRNESKYNTRDIIEITRR